MANTKISQLPLYSGTAADLRWFVMNNSGETITFKYSGYTSPFNISNNTTLVNFQLGSSADTSINYGIAIGSSTLESLDPVGVPSPGASNVVAIGTNVKTLGGDSVVIGNDVTGGTNSVIVGNNIQSLRNYNLGPNMIFGTDITNLNDVYRGDCYVFGYNFELTSDGNSISIGRGMGAGNPTQRNAIHIGTAGKAAGDSSINIGKGTVVGGGSINIQGFAGSSINNTDRSTIIGGGLIAPQIIDGGGANNEILGGEGNAISGITYYGTILSGSGNTISNANMSSIFGGSNNNILCEIPSNERFNMIIGGSGNTIFDVADDQKLQTIFNSIDTTLTNGVERVTAIGLSGRTINDAISGTTYVENLKAFRQIASGFYDNGNANSGGITIDIKNGDKQQITITGTGTTSVAFIGNISGGRVVLKVINTSTGNIGFADNTPFEWKLPAILNPLTPSGTDIYVFDSFGDQSLWLSSHSQNLS